MSWTLEEVATLLGDEAQITAGGISVLVRDHVVEDDYEYDRVRHVMVARLDGFALNVTQEGVEYLNRLSGKDKAEPKKPGRQKKVAEGELELN